MSVEEVRNALERIVEGQWDESLEDMKQTLFRLPKVYRHLLLLRAAGWLPAEVEKAYGLRDVHRTVRRAEAALLKLLNR